MNFIDICSGIGGFREGLSLEGFEPIGFCERDKFAINSYNAMYETKGEWFANDITTLRAETIPYADIWCFGFPCQDISVAGKQRGLNGERSGIYFKIIDLIKSKNQEDRPKLLLIENVKNLLSINRGHDFANVLNELDEAGYNAKWKVLNSKNFGVPQNRERVYIVAFRKDLNFDKFEWPLEFDNGLRLKDMLEDEVDEKYYISQDKVDKLLLSLKGGNIVGNTHPSGKGMNGNVYSCESIAPTITTNKGEGAKITVPVLTPDRVEKRQNGRRFKKDGEPMFTLTGQDKHGILQVGNLYDEKCQAGRVYYTEGMAVTLTGLGGGLGAKTGLYLEPKIIQAVGDRGKHNYSIKDISNTIPSNPMSDRGQMLINNYRIRRLTPKECFRLQGFADEQFEKAQAVNSDSQLYKQAGNAVTVNVTQAIAKAIKEWGELWKIIL